MTEDNKYKSSAARLRSQRTREARAEVCKAMRRGNTDLQEALRHPCIGKMSVLKLLCQLPRVGENRALFMCKVGHIEPYRPVELLNARERATLVARHGLLADARKELKNKRAREAHQVKQAVHPEPA